MTSDYSHHYQIRFSHPSYSEAFQQAISSKGVLTKAGEILSSLLFYLADSKDTFVVEPVAEAVRRNFDKLPENVRNELIVKLGNSEVRRHIYRSDKLPQYIRDKLFKQ